jgi:hypothetical protein
MSEPYEYPEERMQRELLPFIQRHFPEHMIELAKGNELQNGFAVFYLVRESNRIAKLRVSGEAYLRLHDIGVLQSSDIEQLPV